MYSIQFEESVCNLKHKNMRVIMFVAHQDTLASPSHAIVFIVLSKTLKPGDDRRVLLGLCLLGTKGVVGKRVKPNSRGLVGRE